MTIAFVSNYIPVAPGINVRKKAEDSWKYWLLTPQAKAVAAYIRTNGGISARDAMMDLNMTSATLARRVCDLEEAGFKINRVRKTNKATRRSYTRYEIVD